MEKVTLINIIELLIHNFNKIDIIKYFTIISISIFLFTNIISSSTLNLTFQHNLNWSTYRHDPSNSGLQPIKGTGDISDYGIIWAKRYEQVMIYGEPIVANIDLNGDNEIIFGNDNGMVYCLDKDGDINWKFQCENEANSFLGNKISSTPTAIDLIGNNELEIIVSSANGVVYCLSTWGDLIWKYQTDDAIESSPAIDDITGDGILDIVIMSYDGLYALTNDGQLIWKYGIEKGGISSPAISDVNNDNLNDIIVGGINGILYAFTTEKKVDINGNPPQLLPKLLWSYSTQIVDNLGILSSPVVIDLNNDHSYEIIFGASDSSLYCLDQNGNKSWNLITDGPIYNTPAFGDINNDGYLEIIIGTSMGTLYVLTYNGDCIWSIHYQIKIVPKPVIFDIDGDGYLEITSIDESRYIASPDAENKPMLYSINILDYKGDIKHRLKYVSKVYDRFYGVSVADLDNDGKLEILTGTSMGTLYVYGESDENNNNLINSNNSSSNKNYYVCFFMIFIIIIICIIIFYIKFKK